MRTALPGTGVAAVTERLAELAHVLNGEPGLTTREIAERLGMSRRHASLLLLRLEELGHVEHEDRRWYAAPDLV